MKRHISVAAVQMEIEPLTISASLKKAKNLMARIFAKNKVDLVVFPEDFITGPIPYNLELVQDETSSSLQFFQNLAFKYKTYIVCGSVIKKISNEYFNTSFLISKDGEIILEYKKNNLWLPERRYMTPGSEIKIAKTPIGNIGIIICWDLAFPEICRKLAQLGADIICCPSYWTVDDGKTLHRKYGLLTENTFVNILCPARAIENEVLFIYANGAGKASTYLKRFILYEYDRQIARDAERNYKIREDIILSTFGKPSEGVELKNSLKKRKITKNMTSIQEI